MKQYFLFSLLFISFSSVLSQNKIDIDIKTGADNLEQKRFSRKSINCFEDKEQRRYHSDKYK